MKEAYRVEYNGTYSIFATKKELDDFIKTYLRGKTYRVCRSKFEWNEIKL